MTFLRQSLGRAAATGAVWPAQFTNVELVVSCTGCVYTLEGVINGKFDRDSGSATYQRFTPMSASPGLFVSGSPAPSGPSCITYDILTGDDFGVSGYWTNTGTPI